MKGFQIHCNNCRESLKLNENYNVWTDSIEIDFNKITEKIEILCTFCENKVEI